MLDDNNYLEKTQVSLQVYYKMYFCVLHRLRSTLHHSLHYIPSPFLSLSFTPHLALSLLQINIWLNVWTYSRSLHILGIYRDRMPPFPARVASLTLQKHPPLHGVCPHTHTHLQTPTIPHTHIQPHITIYFA